MRKFYHAFSAVVSLQKYVYGDIMSNLLERLCEFLVTMKFYDLRKLSMYVLLHFAQKDGSLFIIINFCKYFCGFNAVCLIIFSFWREHFSKTNTKLERVDKTVFILINQLEKAVHAFFDQLFAVFWGSWNF